MAALRPLFRIRPQEFRGFFKRGISAFTLTSFFRILPSSPELPPGRARTGPGSLPQDDGVSPQPLG